MFAHILIPTDGSALSERAAAAAVRLAAALGARLTALFVAPAPTPLVYEDMLPVGYLDPKQHAEAIERASARHLEAVGELAAAAGVPCECVSFTGEYPAEAILETAKRRKCDLVFMASHGRRGLKAVLLGSETQKVLTHAKVPVLVYR
jgi:nucleotide-binding universal stress UspA family protein